MAEFKIDPRNVFNTANSFLSCAQDLFRSIDKKGFNLVVSPYIVTHAFALELYLKCLLFMEGKTKEQIRAGGHRLIDLYNLTTQASKDLIQNEYKTIHYPSMPEKVRNSFIESQPLKDYSKAEVALLEMGSPFEEWRYIYEKENSQRTLFGLEGITQSVRNRILAIGFK